jgi:GT2 family glycosyltransferase
MEEHPSVHLLGFVVIGRNEGERLKSGLKAIQSICPQAPIIYVDSGSNDDSVNFAREHGITTVELDMSIPFTAARARNIGFSTLLKHNQHLHYVQFLDGDCELLPGWVDIATDYLSKNKDVGIASGRRSERFPDASIYNQLIDIEWNTPSGEILAVLGDMCVKVEVFNKIEGFNETIIAAEDDDFCLRARRTNYKTFRLDANMSKHDANIMKLTQWYRRSKRGGHGYANIHHLHGKGPEQYFKREIKSVVFWGALIPTAFILFLFLLPPVSVLILLGYIAFISKTIVRRRRLGDPLKTAIAYGLLIFSGKISEFMGMLQYYKNHLLSRKHQLIEYK